MYKKIPRYSSAMGTLVTGIPILPYDLFLLSTDHFLYNKKSTKIADPCLWLLDPDTAMIEGSRSGSIHLTSGSGSGSLRPKYMWNRIKNFHTGFWFWIRDPEKKLFRIPVPDRKKALDHRSGSATLPIWKNSKYLHGAWARVCRRKTGYKAGRAPGISW